MRRTLARISLMVTAVLGNGSNPVTETVGNNPWIDSWLGRDGEYDYQVGMEFLQNRTGTAVFPTLCSEVNILLQLISSEYGNSYKERGEDSLTNIVSSMAKACDKKMIMDNRAYISTEDTNLVVLKNSGYDLIKYNFLEEGLAVYEEHANWVKEKSNGLVSTNLKQEDFEILSRIYATIVYFKDQWKHSFIREPDYAPKGDFFIADGESEKRDFMYTEGEFGYERITTENVEFSVVAVPYVDTLSSETTENTADEGNNFARYMIYLVPTNVGTDLGNMWNLFFNHAGKDLSSYITKKLILNYIELRVPLVTKLKTNLDLQDILKNTYGGGPAEFVKSSMSAYINIDEEGTEAAAVVEATCVDGPSSMVVEEVPKVVADKPYISFVFGMALGRVLFMVKDNGISAISE